MQLVERTILGFLIEEAAKLGYAPSMIETHPGEHEPDEVRKNPTLAECIEHIDAWDAYAVLHFRKAYTRARQWFFLVPGNGEDLVSDYGAHPDADAIVKAVQARIEG